MLWKLWLCLLLLLPQRNLRKLKKQRVSDLNIQIAIVLAIYFAIMLVIALLAHVLTKKYNDKE
jgi:hypothetical protein